MMISDRPEATASSTTYWIIGLSTRGSISFGCAFVAGRNRVPRPAAGKTPLRTFTRSSYRIPRARLRPRKTAQGSGSRSPTPDALPHRHDGQDTGGLNQDQHGLTGRRGVQEQRREAKRRGEEEDQQHALTLGEAELLEAMVDVIAPGVGEPLGQRVHLAGHDAPDPDEGDVEKRHAQNERRREQRDDRRVLGPVAHHRQPGEGEADERGAAVAEEDHGAARPEVVRQKAQTRTDERRRVVHEIAVVRVEKGGGEKGGGEASGADGEAVVW